jgi:hypothetical protein
MLKAAWFSDYFPIFAPDYTMGAIPDRLTKSVFRGRQRSPLYHIRKVACISKLPFLNYITNYEKTLYTGVPVASTQAVPFHQIGLPLYNEQLPLSHPPRL